MLHETFPAGAFQCNCTVLACGETRDAIVIDPGGEVEHIAQLIAHHDLTVRAIVHTHAHRSKRMFGGSHHHEPTSPTSPASAIIGATPPPAIIARYANPTIKYVAAL